MSARKLDINGWYEIPDNPISRVGVFPYSGRQIGAPGDPNKIWMVYRPESELSDPDTLASFRLLPWIDDHAMLGDPELSPGLMPAEKKGIQGTLGEQIYYQDRTLYGNLKLFSEAMGTLIDSGKKELSCGFRCMYDFTPGVFEGIPYDAIQRRLRGNHIALVNEGRMGPDVAVLDHMRFTFDTGELKSMADVPEKKDGEVEKKEMTLGEMTAVLLDIGPKLAEMQTALAALSPAPAAAVVDAPNPATPPAASATPAATPTAAPATVDAAMDARLKAAETTIADFKAGKFKTGMDAKAIYAEVASRDKLAGDISKFIGTFDHATMTHDEVAKYGVEKFGLKCNAGEEIAALHGYLHNRTPSSNNNIFALDSAVKTGTGSKKVNDYFAAGA